MKIIQNSIKSSLFAAVLVATALPLMAQQQKRVNSTGGNSPHETTGAVIGDRRTGCRVTITYGRPYAKGRTIWGSAKDKALVPDGKAWRLGSDEATTLITQQPLKFGETTVPAGAYTLYMVPDVNGASKLAISTKLGAWGIPVDESHDLSQVELKKETLDQPVEQLTINVERDSSGTGGTIKISWDKLAFSAPFTVVK